MQELSDEARSMLDVVRDAHDPSAADRRRVRGDMVARLGAAAVISSSAKLAAASGAGSAAATGGLVVTAKWAIGLTLLGVAGASAVVAQRHSAAAGPPRQVAARAPERPRALPVAPPVVASAAAMPGPSAATAVDEPAPGAKHRPRLASQSMTPDQPAADELSEEVRVLGQARLQLRQGQADRALGLLDAEVHRFEHGALREEFLAARILALRELGREGDARASAAEFAAELPGSALLPKVIATESRK